MLLDALVLLDAPVPLDALALPACAPLPVPVLAPPPAPPCPTALVWDPPHPAAMPTAVNRNEIARASQEERALDMRRGVGLLPCGRKRVWGRRCSRIRGAGGRR